MFPASKYECSSDSKDNMVIITSTDVGSPGKHLIFRINPEGEEDSLPSVFLDKKDACNLARDILNHFTDRLLNIEE